MATLLSKLGLRLFENLMGVVIDPSYFYLCIAFGLIISIIIVGLASGFYPALRAGSGLLIHSNETSKPNFRFQRNLRNAFVMSQFVLSIALSISSLIIIRQADFMMKFETGYSKQDIVEYYLPVEKDSVLYELSNWLYANPNVEAYSFGSSSPVSLTVLNTIEKWTWEGLQEGAHTSFYGIGVVRDFNFQHLSSEIRPLAFTYTGSARHLFVRLRSDALGTVGQIQEQISGLSGSPTNFSFFSEEYDTLYRGEQQIISAILFFTVLSILLCILGLIGVVAHGNQARTREIAIRKVFGAETSEMMFALNKSILRIFLPSLFLGSLLAWLVMRQWLIDYVYRRGFEGWVFLLGAFIILIVALLSVSFQTWRAANRSPAVALRDL